MKPKKMFVILLTLMLMLSMTSCSNTNSSNTSSAETATAAKETVATGGSTETTGNYVRQTPEGSLTVGVTTDVYGFDTLTSQNYVGLALVYETLFYMDPDERMPVSLLAESWEYQDDTHLYIKLYDDATFSNGEPVTGEDVYWSWYRHVEASSSELQSFDFVDWDNWEMINDKEFVISFNHTFGPALNYMTMASFSIICKSAMENADEEVYWSSPVGSGPYMVKENVSGSHSTYELNTSYWCLDKMPEAQTVTVRNYSEAATMFIDYETGALDAVFDLAESDVARLVGGEVADSNYQIVPDNDVYSLAFPEYVEEFDDIKVREALACAMDVEALTEIAFGTLGEVADSNLPHLIQFAKSTGVQEYNPERAIELLAEAGYSEGELVFDLVIVTSETDERLATAVQDYFAAVGVKLNVNSCDLATAIGHFMNEETDLVLNTGGGAITLDPHEIFQMSMETSSNTTIRITDEVFNEYCKTGMTSIEDAVREEAYGNAQTWLAENYRMIPICETYFGFCYRPYIEEINLLNTEGLNLRYITFAK